MNDIKAWVAPAGAVAFGAVYSVQIAGVGFPLVVTFVVLIESVSAAPTAVPAAFSNCNVSEFTRPVTVGTPA
jgi:hypothetical protein